MNVGIDGSTSETTSSSSDNIHNNITTDTEPGGKKQKLSHDNKITTDTSTDETHTKTTTTMATEDQPPVKIEIVTDKDIASDDDSAVATKGWMITCTTYIVL